jgi:hypothetical protein
MNHGDDEATFRDDLYKIASTTLSSKLLTAEKNLFGACPSAVLLFLRSALPLLAVPCRAVPCMRKWRCPLCVSVFMAPLRSHLGCGRHDAHPKAPELGAHPHH